MSPKNEECIKFGLRYSVERRKQCRSKLIEHYASSCEPRPHQDPRAATLWSHPVPYGWRMRRSPSRSAWRHCWCLDQWGRVLSFFVFQGERHPKEDWGLVPQLFEKFCLERLNPRRERSSLDCPLEMVHQWNRDACTLEVSQIPFLLGDRRSTLRSADSAPEGFRVFPPGPIGYSIHIIPITIRARDGLEYYLGYGDQKLLQDCFIQTPYR